MKKDKQEWVGHSKAEQQKDSLSADWDEKEIQWIAALHAATTYR